MSNATHSKTIYLLLENGFGNVIGEIINAYGFMLSLARSDGEYQVCGIKGPKFFYRHLTVVNQEEQDKFGLPAPFDIAAILPFCSFKEPTEKLPRNIYVLFNKEIPDNALDIIRRYENVLMRSEIGIAFTIKTLQGRPDIANLLRPAPSIHSYLKDKFALDKRRADTVGIHIRLRQSGDIMPNCKHPVPGWYVNAIKSLNQDVKCILIVSGISSAHADGQEYFETVMQGLREHFPKAELVIVSDQIYYLDFFLLTMIPHLVITNSSFSLLAALLGQTWHSVERVVYPVHLIEELNNWAKIEMEGFSLLEDRSFVPAFKLCP